jgi:hypothetical protein
VAAITRTSTSLAREAPSSAYAILRVAYGLHEASMNAPLSTLVFVKMRIPAELSNADSGGSR